MDIYTIWADKEGDISDLDWVNGMKSFFDHLKSEGKLEDYRITRCKMGFRSIANMPEWMILMEFKDMGQMDLAFKRVAPLAGELQFNTHCSVIGQIPLYENCDLDSLAQRGS